MSFYPAVNRFFISIIIALTCALWGCQDTDKQESISYILCNGKNVETLELESETYVLIPDEQGITARELSYCSEYAGCEALGTCEPALECEKTQSCTCKDYKNCEHECEYTDSCTCKDYKNCEHECEYTDSCTCKDYKNCEHECEYTDSCTCEDYGTCTCEDYGNCGNTVRIRLMAANITSGSHQAYEDPGIHVFQAMKPDIVMIQEFSYESGTREDFVKRAFGEDYYFSFSPEDTPAYSANVIPNGIISRYPILEHGFWDAKGGASNRNWDWAVIDIPGEKDLLAVSVHLTINGTNNERPNLAKKISEKLENNSYYAVLGGDFNTKSRGGAENHFKSLFQMKKCDETRCTYPVDQNGLDLTSGERDDPYDWLLFDHALDQFEVPVTIGQHTYENGHVFDACVYFERDELKDVSPVVASDCGEVDAESKTVIKRVMNMQHMAVIRDIQYTVQ